MRACWLLGALVTAFGGPALAQPVAVKPDLKGDALAQAVRADCGPAQTLNYNAARDKLFGTVDNRNGSTRLLYTPEAIPVPAGGGRPSGAVANTEHVWPQSKFVNAQKVGRIKCDLHHLFPSRDEVNGARSSHPFADIPDPQTKKWWISDVHQTTIPTAQIDLFSESNSSQFEPCEAHKGDVARAMFYVLVVYGDQNLNWGWFKPQLDTLLAWHHQDPADEFEFERSKRVAAVQGNQNPFIQDRTLIYRVLERPVPPAGGPVPVAEVAPGGAAPQPAPPAPGTKIRIVTWNVREVFSVQDVIDRRAEFKAFAAAMKPDVLFLQEVTSFDEARQIRDEMGLTGYHVACSNFVEDGNRHGSFEVAILSRFPLAEVTEFDPTPDNDPTEPNMPETEKKLVPPSLPGLAAASTSRGYLRARIPEAKLIVRVTHLKSSLGMVGLPDKKNAEKRELVAAAMAADTARDAADYPEYTSVTAGDMNVGATDAKKLGTSLGDDDYNETPGADRYDETDALFTGGLVDGLKMTNLATALGQPTFKTGAAAVGPIDWILVAGKNRDQFAPMDRAPLRYGSDHWGVGTFYTVP